MPTYPTGGESVATGIDDRLSPRSALLLIGSLSIVLWSAIPLLLRYLF